MLQPSSEKLTTPTVPDLIAAAERCYVEGPILMRKMMHHRARICPFEILIPHVKPGSTVLDVGCGAGLFLCLAANATPGIRAVGFDSSKPAIATALAMKERLRQLNNPSDLTFYRLDVGEPWPEGLFDVVSVVDVLHHVPPAFQESVLKRAAESVGPGGILLYKDMSGREAIPAAMNRLHDLLLARQWIHYVAIDSIERWGREAKLELQHSESASRLWYRHDLRVFRKPI